MLLCKWLPKVLSVPLKEVGLTLLSVADNHELLARISRAADRNQQLSDILLNPVLCLGDEHSRLCCGREITKMNNYVINTLINNQPIEVRVYSGMYLFI